MKRFHVHLAVDDLDKSILFYNNLFGQDADVQKDDYAKWMLDDPRINFAISSRGYENGVNHFGFQAEDENELAELKQRATAAAGDKVLDEGETTCCYANSNKHWVVDPANIPWEHYHTMSEAETYGVDKAMSEKPEHQPPQQGCCVPTAAKVGCC